MEIHEKMKFELSPGFPKSPSLAAGQLPAHWSVAGSRFLKGNVLQSSTGAAGDQWWFLLLVVSEGPSGGTCWG